MPFDFGKGDSFCAFLVVECNDQVIVEQIDCIDKAIDQTAAVVKLFHIELAVLGEIVKNLLFCDRGLRYLLFENLNRELALFGFKLVKTLLGRV